MKTVPFSEVLPGEAFKSYKTKRAFEGVKVQLVIIPGKRCSLLRDDGKRNAVITKDHTGCLAPDGGTLIFMRGEEMVEVERP